MKPIADRRKEFEKFWKEQTNSDQYRFSGLHEELLKQEIDIVLAFIQSTLTQEREELRKWAEQRKYTEDELRWFQAERFPERVLECKAINNFIEYVLIKHLTLLQEKNQHTD